MRKKICLVSVAILLTLLSFCLTANAQTAIPASVYITQAGGLTCTLASTTMMMRARAYLSNYASWNADITESKVSGTAWGNDGLYASFTYRFGGNSISVQRVYVGSMSLDSVKRLINSHTEGFMLYSVYVNSDGSYNWNKSHAVYVTDYEGDTIYCADPSPGYSLGRIPLTSTLLGTWYGSQDNILAHANYYWHVTGYSISPGDGTKPTITNIKYKDVSSSGYTVTCTVSDNVGIHHVAFPTWTEPNGHDDIISDWGTNPAATGSLSGNTVTFRVNTSEHGNQTNCRYVTHIYAFDTSGNSESAGITVDVPARDSVKPSISNIQVSNVSSTGYTITCNVSDNVGIASVKFPTWYEGQTGGNAIWHEGTVSGNTATCVIKTSDHNRRAGCLYTTHIYAYDYDGNSEVASCSAEVPSPISNVVVSNVDPTGYTITCDLDMNWGIKRIEFPTWTINNGQDDLIWHLGTISNGKGTYRVSVSDHGNQLDCEYLTHIYVFDNATSGGNSSNVGSNQYPCLLLTVPSVLDYTIQYDANGGENPPESQTYSGENGEISSTIPHRNHYHFLGWSEDRSALVPSYMPGDEYTERADITLYAVWERSLENIFVLPTLLTEIDDEAFINTNADVIVVPKTVTRIGNNAFGDVLIYGYTSSRAETYATENNLTFVPITNGWVLESEVPNGAHITEEKWRYKLTTTETTTSKETSLEGWTQSGFEWQQAGTGTWEYASYPTGFDTGNALYSAYNKNALSNSEGASTKREVGKASHVSYIYWHWTFVDAVYDGNYNVLVEDARKLNVNISGSVYRDFVFFDAFESTENYGTTWTRPDGSILDVDPLRYAWRGIAEDASQWWWRFDVYKQDYTDYEKLYTYVKEESETVESGTEVQPGEGITNIQHWVKYGF